MRKFPSDPTVLLTCFAALGAATLVGLGIAPASAATISRSADVKAESLRHYLAARLSDYKVPQQIIAVDDFPRTGTNKVQRKELVSLFSRQ